MLKTHLFAAALAVSGLTVLPNAHAQQDEANRPALKDNQADRSQNSQEERYQARRVSQQQPRAGQQTLTVKEVLVRKLMKANEAEIELATMAQQKTDNQQVKQLTQTIIQDHKALNQQLQQQLNRSAPGQNKSGVGQSQGDRGRDQVSDATERQQTQPGQRNDNNRQPQLRRGQSESAVVPQELVSIGEQACENSLKMTKEMLNNYQGQDFNMGFLGQQIVAHTMALAELKAIESSGPRELQQIASEAASTIEKHLEKAKQLAKKLETDSRSRS